MAGLSLRVAFDHLPQLQGDLARRVREVQAKTALDVQNDWKEGVRVDTGNLRRSIHVLEQGETSVAIGTDVEYAPFENYGTRKMSGSFAREKAVEKNKRPYADAVRGALRR